MTSDWQRLADAVVRRRSELGLTQFEVAQRGPLSLDRVQAIEGVRSTRYRGSTLAALERALEWEYGSVRAVLASSEPTPKAVRVTEAYRPEREPTPAETWAEMERRDKARAVENAELRRQLEQVLRELREEREAGKGQRRDQRDVG